VSVAVPKRRFQRARRPGALREGLVGYGFVAMPMAVFLIFFIYPMVYAIYISRYDWGILGPLSSVGWGNYRSLWHDTLFRRAIRNTLEYTAWVVPAQMALGLLLAVVVNQRIRARTFFQQGAGLRGVAGSHDLVL
jgi:ABC-type sugar transport system permease subunit